MLDYTLEELLYEFFDRTERIKATEEQLNIENDRIEANKEQEVLDWAEAEEKKELEAMKAAAAAQQDPTKDPENVAWMEEQMKQAKKMFGEDFGDDVDESFE